MSSTTKASNTAMNVEVPSVLKLLMLPEELILSCLVRVPRLYYPTLTLVSKSIRSLINSPELFPIPSLDSPPSAIIDGVSSSSVFVMDTHYHTWCKAPRGWGKLDYTNWMEVFDTKTRTWEFMPSPGSESFDYENVALEGSIYVRSNERGETFKLNKGRWRAADLALTRGWSYNWKRLEWREVKRLKGRLPMSSKNDHYRLADYGGNLVFLWEEHVHTKNVQNTTLVWCAEISFERRQRTEICGTIEWCDVVFTYTKQEHTLVHFIPEPLANRDNKLVPIPSLDSPPSAMSVVAAVGSDIYANGGSIDGFSLSSVFVMDTHYHTWCKAPSMHVARVSPSASVLDGKIYVVGGSKNLDYTNWMEVYDTKTQTWEFVPSPGKDIDGRFGYKSASLEGSVYVMDRAKYETFKLNKGRWRVADQKLTTGWSLDFVQFYYCVTENVLYYYSSIDLCWYDFIDKLWRGVKGLEGRLPWYRRFRNTYHHRLADYGGKLVFLWKEYVHTENVQNTTLVWCAEISLERLHRSEIYGTVEWCDVVFTYTTQVDQENTTFVLMHVIPNTLKTSKILLLLSSLKHYQNCKKAKITLLP
ncbi:BnaA03g50980D [Brassica napus]|uniref:BnaA03g50980D protein n=1 Tax=Brassica napus TaxID=3708 RepID=A0A078IEI9_BRANA|nr:BnaA03g50980D [Brassica napus]